MDSCGDVKVPGNIIAETGQYIVTEKDLQHLIHLLDGTNGELKWQSMMERSTPNIMYETWRHELETGPAIYHSRTVFEDAAPKLVRDFFSDDEFRPNWDPMLAYLKTLEECSHTGTMIVHCIEKFPFFCSDREYIIAKRTWEAGKTYYCVTKGVPYPCLPKQAKPRRVDHYFSSWIIRPVESRKGDGQLTACEVTLLHYEDVGIPKDVAKLGVQHGMWGAVKKLHTGMRAYQKARKSDTSLSRSAMMTTRITSKVSPMANFDPSLIFVASEEERSQALVRRKETANGMDWKWVAIGGAVALVFALNTGVIGKALIVGAGRKPARQ